MLGSDRSVFPKSLAIRRPGILVALLLPAVQETQLDGIVLPTRCAGKLWGADGGVGDLPLNFGRDVSEPFTGELKIYPAPR